MTPTGHGLLGLQQPYDLSPRFLRRASRFGARIVRLNADLANLDVDALDFAISRAHQLAIRVLVCATYTPPELGDYHARPDNPAAWARRVGELAARWRGRVLAWEVWNEPNHGPFWTNPDPAAYLELLDPTYRAIKNADPHALVITGGTSPAPTTPGHDWHPLDWYRRLYQLTGELKIAPPWDAIGHHPYSYPEPASTDATWNSFQDSRRIHNIAAWCHHDVPVWATEVGFPVGAGEKLVDEPTQLERLDDLVRSWRAWPWTGPLCWFLLQDDPDIHDLAATAGLLRADGLPRPAAYRFRDHARVTPPAA